MASAFILCLGVLPSSYTTARPMALLKPPTCVFLFRDAGETLSLLPVLRQLRASTLCNVRGVVTGYGTAPVSVLSEPGVTSFAALGIGSPALAQRNCTLSAEAVDHFLDETRPSNERMRSEPSRIAFGHCSHPSAVRAPRCAAVLVTGLVSAVQQQLACATRDSGTAMVVGYDDGLGTALEASSWPVQALRAQSVDELWTVADAISALLVPFSTPAQRVLTVGSPALESWPDEVSTAGPDAIASVRVSAFGVASSTPALLYFGGYGAGYEQSVRTFAIAAAKLQRRTDPLDPPPVAVAFSRHPGPNITTDFERRAFAAEGVTVSFVENVSAALLAAAANLTVSQDSTASDQSLFVGTPSVFCIGAGSPPPANLGVSTGLIPVVDTPNLFERAYERARRSLFHVSADELTELGVPTGAVDRMTDRIRDWLRRWRAGTSTLAVAPMR